MSIRSIFILAALASGFSAAAAGSREVLAPETKLEHGVSAIVDILFDQSPELSVEVKRDRIIATLDEKLTSHYVIRRALGNHWTDMSVDQQREFIRLITGLVLLSYTTKLVEENKPEVSFEAPVELTKFTVEIPSTLTTNKRQVPMAYRMARLKSGWEVYDVHVRGISLTQNYRSQFRAFFETKNVLELISFLREKLRGQ